MIFADPLAERLFHLAGRHSVFIGRHGLVIVASDASCKGAATQPLQTQTDAEFCAVIDEAVQG